MLMLSKLAAADLAEEVAALEREGHGDGPTDGGGEQRG